MLASCATSPQKAEDNYKRAMREGNYSLIILETAESKEIITVLDLEGDPFELIPAESAGEMSHMRGLSRREALIRADERLSGSGVILKAIKGGENIVGYEVYPPPSQGPGAPPGPETEAVLLPNLLRIDYTVDHSGRPRIRIMTLPLKNRRTLMPAE
ncbi:hypothetical protein ACFL4R_02055 [Nitrospirota bacterium]